MYARERKRLMKALILVDIQNDFIPGGALPVPDGDAVVPLANRLQDSGRFDVIVATQDWHPADHGSFAPRHTRALSPPPPPPASRSRSTTYTACRRSSGPPTASRKPAGRLSSTDW